MALRDPRFALFYARCLSAAMMLWLAAAAAYAETLRATPQDLMAQLGRAAPGDVVLLAPGSYGLLRLDAVYGDATRRVTLRSENPADPARFSELELQGAQGLVLENLVFKYAFPLGQNPSVHKASHINNARYITITKSFFDGDKARGTGTAADGYGAGFGISIRFAQDIVIEGSVFRGFYRGLLVGHSQGLILRDSEFYDMRSDGVNFAAVTDVLIERNTFRDFRRHADDPAHADMIQFWTNGTDTPNRNITIRDNILNTRRGDYSQSIFMRNERVDVQGAGYEMYYRNITITGNVIINAHLHGITLGEADGVLIADNTLIRNHASRLTGDNENVHIPIITVVPVSRNVVIARNITSGIAGFDSQPDWRLSGNLKIQRHTPEAPGYYDDVFVAARYGDPETLAPFTYLPEGPAGLRQVGAPALRLSARDSRAVPVVRVRRDAQFVNRFHFDASLNTAGADTRWDFADGSTATGAQITHTFARPGQYDVQARAGAAGRVARLRVDIPPPEVLAFAGKHIAIQQDNQRVALDGVTLPQDNMLQMGQGREPFTIHPKRMAGFFGARDLALDLRLRAADTANPAGEILRIHNNLVVAMTGQGQLQVSLNTAQTPKPVVSTTAPLGLHDGRWHDIALRYDATDGLLRLIVDGREQARARAQGPLRPMESWGLYFGNPWQQKTFDGVLADLSLRTGVTSFAQP